MQRTASHRGRLVVEHVWWMSKFCQCWFELRKAREPTELWLMIHPLSLRVHESKCVTPTSAKLKLSELHFNVNLKACMCSEQLQQFLRTPWFSPSRMIWAAHFRQMQPSVSRWQQQQHIDWCTCHQVCSYEHESDPKKIFRMATLTRLPACVRGDCDASKSWANEFNKQMVRVKGDTEWRPSVSSWQVPRVEHFPQSHWWVCGPLAEADSHHLVWWGQAPSVHSDTSKLLFF